jgi:hypothetical protein
VDEAGPDRHRYPVDLDAVALDVDPATELCHLAVDRDAALGDEVLADAPAAEPGPGQHLLEALTTRQVGPDVAGPDRLVLVVAVAVVVVVVEPV